MFLERFTFGKRETCLSLCLLSVFLVINVGHFAACIDESSRSGPKPSCLKNLIKE